MKIAITTEMRHTVVNTTIQASVSTLSFWDHRMSASQAAAHLPERFKKMYNPDLAYQEQPQGPLLPLIAWIDEQESYLRTENSRTKLSRDNFVYEYIYTRLNVLFNLNYWLNTWIGLAGPGSPGPSMHMCWWLFSGGNLEQSNAAGQGKPNPWSTGKQRARTCSHRPRQGPMGAGTFSVHIGAYTEHRNRCNCALQQVTYISALV